VIAIILFTMSIPPSQIAYITICVTIGFIGFALLFSSGWFFRGAKAFIGERGDLVSLEIQEMYTPHGEQRAIGIHHYYPMGTVTFKQAKFIILRSSRLRFSWIWTEDIHACRIVSDPDEAPDNVFELSALIARPSPAHTQR
jgi:hypothetical protein